MSDSWIVLDGDCLDVLKHFEDNSIDAMVTDPPYGLSAQPDIEEVVRHWLAGDDYQHRGGGFMNRIWDSFVPGPSVWREVFRVLKPGAHALVFAGTRTIDLMMVSLRFAKFEIRDFISWLHGTGFPKSLNVSKAIDELLGAERPVVGENPNHRPVSGVEYEGVYAGGNTGAAQITAAATEEAKRWEGWGTALKPATEPIILARKPIAGTVVSNILAHGTGALNIDATRIGTEEKLSQGASNLGYHGVVEPVKTRQHDGGRWPANVVMSHTEWCESVGVEVVKGDTRAGQEKGSRPGGFADVGAECGDGRPAGEMHGDQLVEVYRCLPGCPVALLDEQSGTTKAKPARKGVRGGKGFPGYDDTKSAEAEGVWPADGGGGASRFFYVAKPPRKERDFGLEHMAPKTGGEATDREDGTAGLKSPRAGAGRTGGTLYRVEDIWYPDAEWVNEVLNQVLPEDTVTSTRKATEGSTIQTADGMLWSRCWCGSPSTDLSLGVMMFTIRTRISSTTDRKTWSCSPKLHTNGCIAGATGVMAVGGNPVAFANNSNPSQKNTGTSASKVGQTTDDAGPATVAQWLLAKPTAHTVKRGIRNTHCTVKGIDLMRWLCRLVTPPGGVILDPFCGSGSTGCAAVVEGFKFVGIELDPEKAGYAEMARMRIAAWEKR